MIGGPPGHAAQVRGGDVADHRDEVAGRQRDAELLQRSGDDDGVAVDRANRRRSVLGDAVGRDVDAGEDKAGHGPRKLLPGDDAHDHRWLTKQVNRRAWTCLRAIVAGNYSKRRMQPRYIHVRSRPLQSSSGGWVASSESSRRCRFTLASISLRTTRADSSASE